MKTNLFDIGKIMNPDSEGYEIYFKQWRDSQLVVTVEGEKKSIHAINKEQVLNKTMANI